MKKSSLWLLTALLLCGLNSKAELIVLSGIYNGKDLYIKNSMTSTGVGYCIYEVRVNDRVTADEVNSAVISVNFKALSMKPGDRMEIVIRCKEDCAIRVLNPEAIMPESTFQMESVWINPNGHLEWATHSEHGSLPYSVEQYKWKRWVKVGEAMGKGEMQRNTYVMDLTLHSGINLFRVTQKDHNGMKVSKEVRVESKVAPVQLLQTDATTRFQFSAETNYELYSEYGELVAQGKGIEVSVRNFPRGTYYLNFDNQGGVKVFKR